MKYLSKSVLRVLCWSLVGTLIILVTIILVAYGQGYRVDFENRQLVGSGLILIDSEPDNAEIYIDGQKKPRNTAARFLLAAGTYNVRLAREGYRDWSKAINVSSTRISDIRYPFLIPDNITTRALKEFSQPVKTMAITNNQEYIALIEGGSAQIIHVLETDSSNVDIIYEMPASLRQRKAQIESIKWAPNNRHLLVTIRLGKRFNYFLLDNENKDSVMDLSEQMKGEVFDLAFEPDEPRRLYFRTTKEVFRLDLDAVELNSVYKQGSPVSLWVGSDSLWVLEANSDGYRVVKIEDNNSKVYLSGLTTSNNAIRLIDYSQDLFLLLTDSSKQTIYFYLITEEGEPELFQTLYNVEQPIFMEAPNHRFLMIKSPKDITMYDFEYKRFDRYNFGNQTVQVNSWLDSFHVLASVERTAFVFEFDGANREDLAVVNENSPVFANRNRERIYSVGKSQVSDNFLLQLSELSQ